MANISIKTKAIILLMGILSSLIIFLMLQVVFAQFFIDALSDLNTSGALMVIILGLLMISFIVSILVSQWITSNVKTTTIVKASAMAYLCNLFLIIIISYVSMFLYDKSVFQDVNDITMIFIFPQVIVYFAIYVLGSVFYLFMLSFIIYFSFYLFFLEKFYEYKPNEPYKQNNVYRRW